MRRLLWESSCSCWTMVGSVSGDDDYSSLGDWHVHTAKLPAGLKQLAENIKEKGLLFGLWFEPEMISEDSDLYRAHPDWCIHTPGREKIAGPQPIRDRFQPQRSTRQYLGADDGNFG